VSLSARAQRSRTSVFISRPARCVAAYPSSVIVSDSEWLSSADIENVACQHPDVASAVCIAARHHERSLLLVVKKPGSALTADELLAFFDGQVTKWWKPDVVVFVESVPLGATGKVLKRQLQEQYGDY
jgi:acyl-CoA synthetase (AMP-forming)/AMP-acid ligase II